MGTYNPHVPQILGEEWVPIRDEDLVFTPSVNSVEKGHSFSLASTRLIRDARFYMNEFASSISPFQTCQIAVYPNGLEDSTGPIKSVLIPVNNGGVTGAGITATSGTVASALLGTGDGVVRATYSGGLQDLSMFFATNNYSFLNNKRILNVSLVYSGFVTDSDVNGNTIPFIDPDPVTALTNLYIVNDAGSGQAFARFGTANTGALWELNTVVNPASNSAASNYPYGSVNFGDVYPLSFGSGNERLPWLYSDLQRFEASAGVNRLHVHVIFQVPTTNTAGVNNVNVILDYAALKVFYCEEQRLIVGGRYVSPYILGANTVTMRTVATRTADPALTAGKYTAAMSLVNPGDIDFGLAVDATFPKLNSLREYFPIPPHQGVQIDIPFPLSSHVGDTFAKQQTHVLPQISVHTSGGPLTEVHVYGRQAIAQVYGTITATQEVLDTAVGSAKSWPQVRYYARRFGSTTVPLLLDSPTITGSGLSVQISPQDFDELDEIIDGWKEVTLRFSTAPTMGAAGPTQWRWSANGENSGDRWEVLGCMAPALSGIPGNLLNQVPSPNQLSLATYGAPTVGDTVNFGWVPQYAPAVTATSDDQTSDGVLIFAQDMLPVTGFSLIESSQAVSGIGPDCGLDPCCIPTEIFYNAISWSKPINTGIGSDGFARSVAAGSWGTADVGGAYTLSGTAADFSVGTSLPPWDTTDHGLITFSAVNSARFAVLNVGAIDFDVTVDVSPLSTPDGGGLIRGGPVGRYTDSGNNYYATADITSAGVVQLRLEKRVASVITQIALTNRPDLSGGIGAALTIRIIGYGTFLKAKIWKAEDPEPPMWDIETTDTDLTTGNFAGVFGRDGSTSTGHTMSYDNLVITPPGYWFGYYELQRMDDLTDWQTIMKATNPAQITFADYEARVGVLSSYRIRAVDVYNFAGPWSSTITSTLTEPGLEIECDGGHVLLFTSNSRQDGSINLAYSSVWDGNASISEDFEFPEVGDVQLQKMYNKDFVTAFRPLERGGERFTRSVLVQAAAISPPTLGDFTALRDMAWDTVPYICVRDEDGNRWFATVLVPAGRVQLNRTIYMASVTIVQVTDTAYPVNP